MICREAGNKEKKCMKQRIKAVFFDIDGTLVSFNTHLVPQSTKDAIKQLRESGIKAFVATGRMLAMTNVLNDIEFDGFVTYNGSYCIDEYGNEIFKNTVPKSELQALAEWLDREKVPVSFMCRDEMYVNYLAPVVKYMADLIHVPYPVEKPVREIIEEDVFQLCVYGDEPVLQKIVNEVLSDCEWSRWTTLFADVNIKGINKSVGIDAMLRHYGFELCNSMAFGDGGNDIAMLKHAGIGVAMGNSNDTVKAAADYVTDTVDNDGVIKALKHFGLVAV